MNEIYVTVNFKEHECKVDGINLIKGDYNSTKMIFNFDREDGIKNFKLKNEDDELVFDGVIEDNEIILTRIDEQSKNHTIFNKVGIYSFAVILYGNDSKLTSAYGDLEIIDSMVEEDEETVISVKPVFDQLLNDVNSAMSDMESVKQEVIHANEEAERIISEFEEDVDTYTTVFNENAEEKINAVKQIYENTEELVNGFDSKVETAKDDLNTIVSNAETIYNNFNTNAAAKLNEYNTNASNKFNEYNTNASSKISAYNTNATEKVEAYNSNATSKLNAYNDNATLKTTAFDTNATNKTNTFDSNAESKTTAYNENAQEKVDEFNQTVDSIQESIDNHEERISDLERNQKTGEATGTEIDLTDAFDTRPRYLGIDAKESKQVTTTGKNLLNIANGTTVSNGITTISYNNILTGSGTSSETWWNLCQLTTFKNNLTAGTYTFSIDSSVNFQVIIRLRNVNAETIGTYIIPVGNTSISFTINEEAKNFILFTSGARSTIYNYKIKTMIENNPTATDFEPYTGGNPSPSPEFPQDVETMVGITNEFNLLTRYETPYTKGITANKIDENNIDIIADGTSDYQRIYYSMAVVPNTDYKFKANIINSNANVTNNWLMIRDKSFNNSIINVSYSSENIISFNSGNNDTIIIGLYANTSAIANTSRWRNIQLTEGTEEKPYVPYGTNYMLLDDVGKNLLNNTLLTTPTTINGITATPNSDGTITLNGTASGSVYINLANQDFGNVGFTSNTGGSSVYIASIGNAGSSTPDVYMAYDKNNHITYIYVRNGVQVNTIIYPMIRLASITDDTYEPYQHKQYPISLANQELLNKNNYVDKIIVDESTGQSYIEKNWRKLELAIADMDNSEDFPGWRNLTQLAEDFTNFNGKLSVKTLYLSNMTTFEVNGISINTTSSNAQLFFAKSIFNLTQSEWKTQYPDLVVVLYYGLQNPQLIPIDNPNIKLLNGVNHITNSEGAEMDIVYVKDINTYLENELSNIKNAIVSLGGDI